MSGKMPITPSVMEWCRKKAGFSIGIAAEKIGRPKEDIEKWENGMLEPTLSQLRKASEVYKFPTAVFFLPEPPKDFSPLKDFRAFPDNFTLVFSPELSLAIREAQARQEWVREYHIEEGIDKLDFIGTADINTDRQILAKEIRNRLSVTIAEQKGTANRDETLRLWVRKAEDAGIYVFQHRKIDLGEARGFALCDSYAPFVFLNANDARAGMLFTLIHEIIHLWINESGVSNLEHNAVGRRAPEQVVEQFCNTVASEVLVDANSFNSSMARIRKGRPEREIIEMLANEFKVSEEVIARKMLELGNISSSFYSLLRKEYQSLWIEIEKSYRKKMEQKEGGPSYYKLKAFNNGYAFTNAVLSAYSGGHITGRDASALLNVKINNFGKLSDQVRPLFSVGR